MPALWLSFAALFGLVAAVVVGWQGAAILPRMESSATTQ
jgi:hypothetical protein